MVVLDKFLLHSALLIIIFAYILDLLLGDPKWLTHPVRLIGRYITFLEDKIRRFTKTPLSEKSGGIFLFIIVVGSVYGLTGSFLYIAHLTSYILYLLLAVFLAYTTLSIKSLHQEAYSVIHALKKITPLHPPLLKGGTGGLGIDAARKRLSNIVGRDTQNLSEEEIYRAVVETVAENTSDGIIAPLFYLAVGGPALALVYKAVNTLDSMVGYKNERYKNFGWFSARMDDIANFIPARLTSILIVAASFILRFNWKDSLKIIWRNARNHPSPNAGYPESAVAGALGIQLGGTNYYFGAPHKRPLIGDKNNEFTIKSVKDTVKIMHLTAFLGVILLSGFWLIFDLCTQK